MFTDKFTISKYNGNYKFECGEMRRRFRKKGEIGLFCCKGVTANNPIEYTVETWDRILSGITIKGNDDEICLTEYQFHRNLLECLAIKVPYQLTSECYYMQLSEDCYSVNFYTDNQYLILSIPRDNFLVYPPLDLLSEHSIIYRKKSDE